MAIERLVTGEPFKRPGASTARGGDALPIFRSARVLIAGRKPFVAESPVDMWRLHRDAPPPPLRGAAPDLGISEKLEWIVSCALAKSQDERFWSADAFHAALGFSEVGRAELPARQRTVRYLARRL